MRFTLGLGTRMAGMQMRVVPHLDPVHFEGSLYSYSDSFRTIHEILQRFHFPGET